MILLARLLLMLLILAAMHRWVSGSAIIPKAKLVARDENPQYHSSTQDWSIEMSRNGQEPHEDGYEQCLKSIKEPTDISNTSSSSVNQSGTGPLWLSEFDLITVHKIIQVLCTETDLDEDIGDPVEQEPVPQKIYIMIVYEPVRPREYAALSTHWSSSIYTAEGLRFKGPSDENYSKMEEQSRKNNYSTFFEEVSDLLEDIIQKTNSSNESEPLNPFNGQEIKPCDKQKMKRSSIKSTVDFFEKAKEILQDIDQKLRSQGISSIRDEEQHEKAVQKLENHGKILKNLPPIEDLGLETGSENYRHDNEDFKESDVGDYSKFFDEAADIMKNLIERIKAQNKHKKTADQALESDETVESEEFTKESTLDFFRKAKSVLKKIVERITTLEEQHKINFEDIFFPSYQRSYATRLIRTKRFKRNIDLHATTTTAKPLTTSGDLMELWRNINFPPTTAKPFTTTDPMEFWKNIELDPTKEPSSTSMDLLEPTEDEFLEYRKCGCYIIMVSSLYKIRFYTEVPIEDRRDLCKQTCSSTVRNLFNISSSVVCKTGKAHDLNHVKVYICSTSIGSVMEPWIRIDFNPTSVKPFITTRNIFSTSKDLKEPIEDQSYKHYSCMCSFVTKSSLVVYMVAFSSEPMEVRGLEDLCKQVCSNDATKAFNMSSAMVCETQEVYAFPQNKTYVCEPTPQTILDIQQKLIRLITIFLIVFGIYLIVDMIPDIWWYLFRYRRRHRSVMYTINI